VEGFIGGCADGDVIGMSEDAVRSERAHHRGLLLHENGRDPGHQLLERDLINLAIGVTEPLMSIRFAAEGAPPRLILLAANRAECLPGRREVCPDVAVATVRGVDQDEPEPRISAWSATIPAMPYASSSG